MSATARLLSRLPGRDIAVIAVIAISVTLVCAIEGAPRRAVLILPWLIGTSLGLVRFWETHPGSESGEDNSIRRYLDQLRAKYPAAEADLARELGISLARYRSWPSDMVPSDRTLRTLAHLLDVPITTLQRTAGRIPFDRLKDRARANPHLVDLLWRLVESRPQQIDQILRMAR